jgi:hypothetical protein
VERKLIHARILARDFMKRYLRRSHLFVSGLDNELCGF